MNPKRVRYYFFKEPIITSLVIFFGITFNVGQVFSPIFLGNLIDSINEKNELGVVFLNVGLYMIVVFGVQSLRFFKRFFVRLFANRTSKRMRQMMYDKTLNESLSFISQHTMGDLMTRCIGDVDDTVEGIRKSLTEIFDTGVLMISYFVSLMLYDYKVTLLASIFIPIAMLVSYLLKGSIYKAYKEYRNYTSSVNEKNYELIDHALIFRSYGTLDKEIDEYNTDLQALRKKAIKGNLLEGSMEPVYKAIGSLGIVAVIYFIGKNVIEGKSYFNGVWTIGLFTTYLKLFVSFTRKASKASKLFNTITKAKISYKRVEDYLEEPRAYDSKIETPKFGDLEVSGVNYGIIHDLTFNAKKGQIIGVTGTVASGKTTLGEALLGMYDYSGVIKLNNVDISKYSQEERSSIISYSGHDSYLLSDSIKNNITFGNGDCSEILKVVDFNKDLENMKDGVNTLVGSKGVLLSGGQKQRISLARALYEEKNLIILDDPFSACDAKTEENIINNIRGKYHNSIIILISHRLRMFPFVDKVIFLDKGSYVFDTHENLLKNTSYKELVNLQEVNHD